MVDALALKGDEGRGLAAICFGEVPSNLRSEDLRMGKPLDFDRDRATLGTERTRGSKTFQYPEEKKTRSARTVFRQ